jgi:hypothetical protein
MIANISALFSLDLASAYMLIKGEVRRTALPRDRMLICNYTQNAVYIL